MLKLILQDNEKNGFMEEKVYERKKSAKYISVLNKKLIKKIINQNHSKQNAHTMLTFFLLPSIMTAHDYPSLFHHLSRNR